jgi:uncharacterized protein
MIATDGNTIGNGLFIADRVSLPQFKNAPGYTPAFKVRDYTHTIALANDRFAILNLITGRYWTGSSSGIELATRSVEENSGEDPADSRLANIEQRYVSNKENKPRQTALVVLPTYGCNVSCGYCYEGKLTQNQKYWSVEEARKAASAVLDFIKKRNINPTLASLTVLGGEPVRVDHAESLVELVKSIACAGVSNIQIITNGVELASCAEILATAGVTSAMVTIDGPKELHDKRRPSRFDVKSSFEASVEGIDAALKSGISVTVRVNTDSENLSSISLLGEFFLERNFFSNPGFGAYLYPVTTDFRTSRRYATEAELAEALSIEVVKSPILKMFSWELHGLDAIYAIRAGQQLSPKLRYCGATTDQYVMDTNWNMFPCWFGTGKDGFKLGEFNPSRNEISIDDNLDRAWRSRGPFSLEPCKSCKWALVCGSGCSFKAHLRTGSFEQPNCASFDTILKTLGPLILDS